MSVEVEQSKRTDICMHSYGSAVSALSALIVSYCYCSYCYCIIVRQSVIKIVVSQPVDRPLLWVPACASILFRLATIVDAYPH